VYPETSTVEQVLDSAFEHIFGLQAEMRQLEKSMGGSPAQMLSRYGELASRFEAEGGYETELEKNLVCNGLGIPETMRAQSVVPPFPEGRGQE
jgi:ATPase subunit of ABC transporter with duplicated ATPase domains